ncbi:MAG: hypothetical protein HC854_00900 [Flavobacterium sp.]|nr:hypothetical protein [Flavobacterium sp.]
MKNNIVFLLIIISFWSCKKEPKEKIDLEEQIENPIANLNTIVVDEFPISDEILKKYDFSSKIGKLSSQDQVWFKNTNSNQVLIIELYTDYHRINTLLFYNYNIPNEVLHKINLTSFTDIATLEEKRNHINAFALNANEIDKTFFESNNKIKLGINKELAISIYKEPDTLIKSKNVEILEWEFYGDKYLMEYPEKIKDVNNKYVAKNSFGHKIELFFIKDKLIAMHLFNEIP